MRRMILACTVLLALSTGATAGQIYKWVDAQGNVHFGSQPPEGQEAAAVNPNISQPKVSPVKAKPAATDTPDTEDAAQREYDDKEKEKVAKEEKQRQEYCESMRSDLAMLKNNPRLRVEEGSNARRMTEDERQARIAENEKKIAEHCR